MHAFPILKPVGLRNCPGTITALLLSSQLHYSLLHLNYDIELKSNIHEQQPALICAHDSSRLLVGALPDLLIRSVSNKRQSGCLPCQTGPLQSQTNTG